MEERPPSSDPARGDADGASADRRRREVLVTAWPDRTPDPDAPRPRASRHRDPPMPARIGRFRLVRPLGSGGMSVVYEAHDDRLDRSVALKLLRERGGRRRQARLLREAQALARLSHPNVVEVYETGSHEGRAFLVMERLPGEPLQRWLTAAPRSVPQVIETFVQAGRGLSAAHAQGLVHRDFKPSNVLVDADGRVRVFDFGLAAPTGLPSEDSAGTGPHPSASSGPRTMGTGPHPSASSGPRTMGTGPYPQASGRRNTTGPHAVLDAHAEAASEIWEGALTRTGAMLGTPAYMSPEQYEGRPATAQSDQFAFCVALWGSRPREPNTAKLHAFFLQAVGFTGVYGRPRGLPSSLVSGEFRRPRGDGVETGREGSEAFSKLCRGGLVRVVPSLTRADGNTRSSMTRVGIQLTTP